MPCASYMAVHLGARNVGNDVGTKHSVEIGGTKRTPGTAQPSGRRRSESGEAVRQNVKSLATEMFIRRGYNGVTFLDLSKALGINHSLIHYHFGTKAKLAEEVLKDFSETGIRENKVIWGNSEASLFDKFIAARDRMYRRFLLFNPTGKMQHPTGLVSRFSMDAESLTPELREMVKTTQESLDQCIEEAVRIAIARRELVPQTPVQLVVLQISSILFVAGPTARYGWEFNRLDDHFHGTLLTLMRAFGVRKSLPKDWPPIESKRGRARANVRAHATAAAAAETKPARRRKALA